MFGYLIDLVLRLLCLSLQGMNMRCPRNCVFSHSRCERGPLVQRKTVFKSSRRFLVFEKMNLKGLFLSNFPRSQLLGDRTDRIKKYMVFGTWPKIGSLSIGAFLHISAMCCKFLKNCVFQTKKIIAHRAGEQVSSNYQWIIVFSSTDNSKIFSLINAVSEKLRPRKVRQLDRTGQALSPIFSRTRNHLLLLETV